jgi:hypothetical protein
MPLIGAIGAGIGGIISGFGANSAANKQAQAAQQAEAYAKQNQAASTTAQNTATQQDIANQSPFLQAGTTAEQQLAQGTQAGGSLIAGYGQTFQAPTGVTEQNDPGYQFRLEQGQKALENSAAARGGLLAGGTAKSLEDYAQGSASNEYGNVYNRALTTFNSGLNQYNTQQQNAFNRIGAVAGTGQTAANELGQLGQAGAQNIAGINANATNAVTGQINNVGAAQAAGRAGVTNAITGAVPGVTTGITGFLQQQQQQAAQQAAAQQQLSDTSYNVPGSAGFQSFDSSQ